MSNERTNVRPKSIIQHNINKIRDLWCNHNVEYVKIINFRKIFTKFSLSVHSTLPSPNVFTGKMWINWMLITVCLCKLKGYYFDCVQNNLRPTPIYAPPKQFWSCVNKKGYAAFVLFYYNKHTFSYPQTAHQQWNTIVIIGVGGECQGSNFVAICCCLLL